MQHSSTDSEAARLFPTHSLDKRHRYPWKLADGTIVSVDLIVCAEEAWPDYPQSRDPEWNPWFHGGLCFAAQLPRGVEGRAGE